MQRAMIAGLAGLLLGVHPDGASAKPAGVAAAKPAAPARLLPLAGGRNFRDLGGYAADSGKTVKWGELYRSGSMHGLTPADFVTLSNRRIRVICDFRSSGERAAEPVNWPTTNAPRVLSDDYELDMTNFLPRSAPKNWTADLVRTKMVASYPLMLTQFNGQYRRMFIELLAHNVPLAFNCSAGKDRTGIAAALILTALGVPRETVIADYLLTNQYLDPIKMVDRASAPGPANPIARLPPQLLQPLLAADRSYIEAALSVLETHEGGSEGYFRDKLGLSQLDIDKLRTFYLQ